MHKPESVREKETQKILCDLETDHIIPARRLDLVLINKKENLPSRKFCRSSGWQRKNKSKRKDRKILDLSWELKKLWNMRLTVILVVFSALGTAHKSLEKELEELETRGKLETIQTTVLLRSAILAVTQIPGKDYQRLLVRKTH